MGRRPKPEIDRSNLRFNQGTWQIRIKLPESLGGRRMSFNTGTADLATAATIRDQTLAPLRMQAVSSEITRSILAQAHQSDAASRMLLDRAKEAMGVSVPTGPTVREVARRFIENRRTFKLRSGHTVYDYTRTLEAFEAVIGNIPINQVTKQHVRDFRDKLCVLGRFWNRGEKISLTPAAEADRLSPKTIHKMIKNLSTCLGWCLREDLIDKNPALGVDLPTVSRNPTRPPPPELADALCSLSPLKRASTVGLLEWEVMPWFYRFSGARCGEVAQLRLQDIVTEDGVLCMWMVIEKAQLRSEKNKGEIRRLVPVHPRLKPYLDRVLDLRQGEPPEAKLFPNAGDYFCKTTNEMRYGHGWSNHYNDHAKKIWAPMHVHCWRAYVITETGRRGIPEEVRRKLVGHVPRDVHAWYNHVDLKRLVEAVNAIP